MIYYFSGTGNSKWVAEQLAARLNERLIPVADAMLNEKFRYTLAPGESIGWVFPTYSWGPAPIVTDFISRWYIEGYIPDTYCYMVTTCGDEVGLSVDIWRKALGSDIKGNAAFSVQMPNNYILLPGYDVDSKEVERTKIMASKSRVEEVASRIAKRDCSVDVVVGKWKWMKSRLIRPMFVKYSLSDKQFTVEADKCTSCGVCQRNCPMHNIKLDGSGRPTWNGNCALCLSCIHRCPTAAIQNGTQSQKKGRYYFKDI